MIHHRIHHREWHRSNNTEEMESARSDEEQTHPGHTRHTQMVHHQGDTQGCCSTDQLLLVAIVCSRPCVRHWGCTYRDSACWSHCRSHYNSHCLVRRTHRLANRRCRHNIHLAWNRTPNSTGNRFDHRSADRVCIRRCGDRADRAHRKRPNSSCYLRDRSHQARDIWPLSQRRRAGTQGARRRRQPRSAATVCAGLVALQALLPNCRTDCRPHHSLSLHARAKTCRSHGEIHDENSYIPDRGGRQ